MDADDDEKAVTLKLLDKESMEWLDKEAAWVGFHIGTGFNAGGSNILVSLTLTRPNGTSIEMYKKAGAFTEDSKYDVVVPITMNDLQQAVLGDGIITRNYTLTWNISENTDGEPGEHSVEIKQNIIFKIDANKIQIEDQREESDTNAKTIWDENIAKIYKLEHPVAPATPTEEDKTTEENKKDDVPKTVEVI